MTKKELIKAIEPYDDYSIIVIGDFSNADPDSRGWSNIDTIKSNGSVISIIEDYTRPFSGD
jgi:hypothetical protein